MSPGNRAFAFYFQKEGSIYSPVIRTNFLKIFPKTMDLKAIYCSVQGGFVSSGN